MSLLNDMLRDLSRHKTVAEGAEGYDESLLQSSSITRPKEQHWRSLTIVFVAVFIIVLGVSYSVNKAFKKDVTQQSQNPIVQQKASTDAVAPATRATATAVMPDQPKGESISEPANENAASAELQNHIADLLLQAERAISMDRLTSPVEDNAYGYYQKILAMDANNAEAKDGLDNIASRYLAKAQEHMALGNITQAESLVQRARFVSERYVAAHEISLEQTSQATDEANHQLADESHGLPVQNQTATQQAGVSEIIKPFAVAEAPMISVSPNAAWKDEQLARHAQDLISQGKQAEAQALLKAFVAKEQKPAMSAALLADLYIQQGNSQAADIILQKTDYLAVDIKAKLQAQIFSANGDDAQAITVLERNINSAEANEPYRALLASLYHKTANYSQSIISYQRLMGSFGEKPAYWLGLALAHDGLSQHKSALQAYQRLREYPQLQEQVKKYTDQRIAALQSVR